MALPTYHLPQPAPHLINAQFTTISWSKLPRALCPGKWQLEPGEHPMVEHVLWFPKWGYPNSWMVDTGFFSDSINGH